MALFEGLNEVQRAAASFGNDPLLIIAGAGTGKTTTLVHRVGHLIQSGIEPPRILLLTYTRRAAAMMIERTRKLLGDDQEISGLWAGTFHGISVRLLHIFGQALGLPSRFSIHDRSDSEDLIESLLKKLKADTKDKSLPKKGTALSIHSYCMNSQWPLDQVLEEHYPDFERHHDLLSELFRAYQEHKRQLGIADFDDLLLLMREMAFHQQIGPRLRERFQAILVDEYQDTNVLQSQILLGLSRDGHGLTVVGDDAQSIYSFRAATIRNILDFPKHFPDAHIVKLEQNYRSTAPLLQLSNAVIAQAKESFDKQLWSQRTEGSRPQLIRCYSAADQAEIIVKRILRHKAEGVPLARQAVLFRAGHHSTTLETELMRNHINFVKYGGLKFVEAAHVKDLLAFLRVAENSKDTVAASRILMLLPGIGPRKAGQIMGMLEVSTNGLQILQQTKPPMASASMWPGFVKLMTDLEKDKPPKLSDQLIATLNFYKPLLELQYEDANQRWSDLQQLLALSDRFESRTQMLADLALDPPTSTEDLPDMHEGQPVKKNKEPPLVLSTIHSAKGLEWEVVYVMSAMNGCLPMPRALEAKEGHEEERRLLYVALTRAVNYLYVSYEEAGFGGGFTYGYSNPYAAPTGGLTEYLDTPAIRTLFQKQSASKWVPIESIKVEQKTTTPARKARRK